MMGSQMRCIMMYTVSGPTGHGSGSYVGHIEKLAVKRITRYSVIA